MPVMMVVGQTLPVLPTAGPFPLTRYLFRLQPHTLNDNHIYLDYSLYILSRLNHPPGTVEGNQAEKQVLNGSTSID